MEKLKKKGKIMIKIDDYSMETIVGIGAFGKVKLARRKKDG
jgi:hypothetical protein